MNSFGQGGDDQKATLIYSSDAKKKCRFWDDWIHEKCNLGDFLVDLPAQTKLTGPFSVNRLLVFWRYVGNAISFKVKFN